MRREKALDELEESLRLGPFIVRYTVGSSASWSKVRSNGSGNGMRHR